LIIIGLGSPY